MKKRALCSLLLIISLVFSFLPPAFAAENEANPGTETETNPGSETEENPGGETETNPAALTLSETALTIEPNETAVLTATAESASSVNWSVVDRKVVTLDKELGASVTLAGVSPGRTTVMARLGAVSEPCTVTVSGIVITPDTLELGETEKGTLRLASYGAAEAVEAANWTWSSDKTDVATVEKTDTGCSVTAVSIGTATITCTNGTYSATCALTVKEKEATRVEVSLTPSSLVLEVGKASSVTATSTANPEEIKWGIEDESIAKVEPAAGEAVTVTGLAPGRTNLTSQAGVGPVARCVVIVSGITFAAESVGVEVGKTLDLTVSTYGEAVTVPVSSWEWTSSDTSVATVTLSSAGGTIRGIQAGTASVTVKVGDYQASCQVKVEAVEASAAIALSEATITMAPGTSSRLRATTIADSADIKWYIENTDITQIATKNGYTVILTAGNPGQTTITASVGSSDPASCTVIVSGVKLSSNSLAMTVNGIEKLTRVAYGEAQTIPNWEWSSSNTGVAIVVQESDGATVRAVGAGSSTITCTGGSYTVLCQVSVAANEASAIETNLDGGLLKMGSIVTKLREVCQTMTEDELSYITNLSIDTKLGTLYDGYVSEGDTGFGVASNRNYYVSNAAHLISNITFVPKPDVNGTVRINYDGFTVNNKTFTGSIIISVGQQETTLAYASLNGAPIHFRAEDFFNYSMSVYNRSLQYLTFTMPATRYGTLYYSYVDANVYESIVSGGTRYYRTYNPGISNVAFVPNPSYSGNFSLNFTGYDTEGASFTGVVRISVNNPNGSDSGHELRERLHYETGPGARVYFETEDFVNECKERTGYNLVSIRFRSLPSSNDGRVYEGLNDYAYADTEYSVNQLKNLNFKAHKSHTGEFTIPFTGSTDKDNTFTGQIYITVSNNGAYLVRMAAASGTRVYLSSADFTDISAVAGKKDFHHLSFSALPSNGTLYYDNGTERVTPYAIYYRSGETPFLSNVNYLSPDDFSGDVRIPYTLWDSEGESFSGYLSILVTKPSLGNPNASATGYTTTGPAIPIRASDILTPAIQEIGEVTSVHLTPPSPAVGKLVLNYLSPGQYSAFDSSRDYSSDTLEQVYFLPKAGYRGAAAITYVARNRYNIVYSGILRIQVSPPVTSAYFTDLYNRAWAVPAVDFFRYYNVLIGTTPTTYEPDGPARRGAYITVLGRMYGFPNYPGNGGYDDVELNFYYTPYIAAGRALGVTEASQYFYPGAAISRQDAAVYLYRCLARAGQAPAPDINNLARFHDGYMVAYYAMEAMSALVEMGVFQGTEDGYLNPYSTLTRLQMAAILYRAMT